MKKTTDIAIQCDLTHTNIEQDEEIDSSDPPKYTLMQTLQTNWIFYITIILCIGYLSRFNSLNFVVMIYSLVAFSLLGYVVHYVSHHINFTEMYKRSNNYITRSPILNYFMSKTCNFMDFHDATHHDIEINKTPMNILYEFFNNLMMQGLIVIGVIKLSQFLSLKMALLWGLFYATYHNINLLLDPTPTHMYHHKDKHSNYGIDAWDIFMGTKHPETPLDNYNLASINVIIITLVINWLS